MDINLLRSAVTVLSLLLFAALVVWTWQRSRRQAFDEAALLPFMTDEGLEPTIFPSPDPSAAAPGPHTKPQEQSP